MSLQYVEPSSMIYPPQVILARGGGNQKPGTKSTEGVGKPANKAAKKAAKKAPTTKKK